MIPTIISGGQTGADLAGLLAAKLVGFPTGGMMPQGFRTQSGNRPWMYPLLGCLQNSLREYPPRTEVNVQQSDVTVAIAADFQSAGEKLTMKLCLKHKRPIFQIGIADCDKEHAEALADDLFALGPRIINIAGNSEKTCPGITDVVLGFLVNTFLELKRL